MSIKTREKFRVVFHGLYFDNDFNEIKRDLTDNQYRVDYFSNINVKSM